ncbi:MAG: shikimate dehydrogenase [Candidatus Altiarchaeota archaeon]|nr:shikimate dehydrogenase [Candidatus Altiarchaeota archaeon]
MEEKTRLFGVIGHPIKHSLSPIMHNAAFKKLGLRCSYSAFDVAPEDLEAFVERCRENNFSGFNVTVPYKEKIMEYLDSVDENSKLINAVNTVKLEGRLLVGYNTDGLGCVKALGEAGEKIKGKRVLLLGAGGAARAISFQCVLEGAELMISNRTMMKAMDLSKEIKEKLGRRVLVVNYSEKSLKDIMPCVDVLVNTTTVGMHPKIHSSPISMEALRKEVTVMDIIYNPLETQLLRNAKKKGCKTINGVGMLVHQGAESLRIWLNTKPPTEEMRKAVMEKLG